MVIILQSPDQLDGRDPGQLVDFIRAYTGTGVVVQDCELIMANSGTLLVETNFTARRCNIHGGENGMSIANDALVGGLLLSRATRNLKPSSKLTRNKKKKKKRCRLG